MLSVASQIMMILSLVTELFVDVEYDLSSFKEFCFTSTFPLFSSHQASAQKFEDLSSWGGSKKMILKSTMTWLT